MKMTDEQLEQAIRVEAAAHPQDQMLDIVGRVYRRWMPRRRAAEAVSELRRKAKTNPTYRHWLQTGERWLAGSDMTTEMYKAAAANPNVSVLALMEGIVRSRCKRTGEDADQAWRELKAQVDASGYVDMTGAEWIRRREESGVANGVPREEMRKAQQAAISRVPPS